MALWSTLYTLFNPRIDLFIYIFQYTCLIIKYVPLPVYLICVFNSLHV